MRGASTTVSMALLAAMLSAPVLAGPPPGVPTPWNGPWGGGYMSKEPYLPWDSPYYAAGYGYYYPDVVHGLESSLPFVPGQGSAGPGVQFLPGGGYIILPGAFPRELPPGAGRGY
jgi:hypothetical protein